jgi:FAD/FMN-containing dehydrogenase/Fe-S oxidoreductase
MPELPVLNTRRRAGAVNAEPALAAELRALIRGEVRFDEHNRLLYATDASLYQVEPLGVVIPRDLADVEAAVRFCARHDLPILPRGGGTSLAGQCTNRAVVIDMSAGCRGIGAVAETEGRKSIRVEPGVTVDELNRELALRRSGVFFAPDPATSAQATVGGCIGNNAAGGRSIRYGRTSENLAGVDVLLSTGERTTLSQGAGGPDPVARRLGAGALEIARRNAGLIRERFPRTIRRNAGYGLDLVLDQLEKGATPETVDLSGLLCGSEGTLAVTLRADVLLHPLPSAKGLAVISFATLEEAIEAVKPILDLGLPRGLTAVELLDDVVLDAARGNLEYRKYVDLLPGADAGRREPKAVLYVEFFGFAGGADDVQSGLAALRQFVERVPGFRGVACYTDGEGGSGGAMLSAWKLRKAGEPLLHGLPGPRKPITFVEDNAVPVERLGEFVREFKKIVARHGTRAAYWAHASVGVLHVRPMIDLHDAADRQRLREIAVEVADLARACGGIMSGEHGDGRVRGPLLERFFGPDLMRAFRELKQLFDPRGILNPGMVVGAGPIDSITDNLRALAPEGNGSAREHGDGRADPGDSAQRRALSTQDSEEAVRTFFSFEDQHGLRGAAEMCNGAGVCRKRNGGGGTMCPSYMATLDERHSTRGRGNALRLAITGQIGRDADSRPVGGAVWDDPATIETLDLCLSCKACKSECPSNVDIARLKAEYTGQRYRATGRVPLSARAIGHVRFLNRAGSAVPRLANWGAGLSLTRGLLCRLLGISPKRSLPLFERSLYRWFAERERGRALGGSRWRSSEDREGPVPPPLRGWQPFSDADHGFRDSDSGGVGVAPPVATRLRPVGARRQEKNLVASSGDARRSQAGEFGEAGADSHSRPRVVLFADCFTTYNEPRIGIAAARVLEHLGYDVDLLPREGEHGFSSGCCGRSMISVGLLEDAIETADETLASLRPAIEDDTVEAILVCEPSCLSAIKDDWLQLNLRTPMGLRKKLAQKALLVEDFIGRTLPSSLPLSSQSAVLSTSGPVLLHAHCHQKALWGADTSAAVLRQVLGSRLHVLDSGCCGMAGSFGYAAHRYELSMQIGELSLFPAVRTAGPDSVIVAPGTSCRHQIKDATGRRALHPIELIARAIGI